MDKRTKKRNTKGDIYARHKRRSKIRAIRKLVIKLFLIAVLIAAAVTAFLMFAPFFNITNVEIEGNGSVDSKTILSSVENIIIKGNNIFKTSFSDAEKAIMEIPRVKSCDVSSKKMSVVVINITERKPYGYAEGRDMFYIFDEEGIIIEEAESAPEGIMLVRGISTDNAELGGKIGSGDEDKSHILKTLTDEINNKGINERLHEINIENTLDISFVYGGGIVVRCGDIYNIEQKLSVFSEMLKDEKRIKPYSKGTVDLRIQGSGYYNTD